MQIEFLGTGTSTGVPQIGCMCKTCTSDNVKDKRLRASILVSVNNTRILIDCGPDFRQQMIRSNIPHLSGILITHEHYDHLGGLDDVRPFGSTHVYAEARVLKTIQQNLSYSFQEKKYPGVPQIHLHEISTQVFEIEQLAIQPIRIMHAKLPIVGFRIGNMAYLTDVKSIPNESFEQLTNLDILILSALRTQEHISHLTLNEAITIAEKINAKQTFFTHMSHDMGLHYDTNKLLKKNIQLAYDGMIIATSD